jgi:hypothetical protein
MHAAIAELQKGFLDDAQIESSRAIMGFDTQLIDDGTYFVIELDRQVAGGRDVAPLDPATDAARVRAMGFAVIEHVEDASGAPRCSSSRCARRSRPRPDSGSCTTVRACSTFSSSRTEPAC